LRSFIPTELFEELRKTAGIVTVEKPTSAVTDWIPIVKPPFDDLEVRKAAALAMCQEEGIAVLGPINGTKFFGGPLPPGSAFALPEAEIRKIPGYGHDCAERLKQGRDILTQKGLMGSEITLTFWVNNTFIGDSTLWAADRLQKLGFKVRLNGHERAKFYELVNTRSHPAPGGHAHSLGLSSTTVDGILGEAFHPGGIRNYGGYDDPTLRRLFEEQSKERDQSRRAQLLADYQRHFLSQYYHAVIGWGREYYAWREYVKGYSPTFNLYGNLTFDEVGLDK
jgi:peptide/nickel transport system substrate-binding protein